jgi:hypothetical protein
MRRLRLAAPSLSERGPGLDANTVAEYLDNTLSGGRVPDFEKVCLESDVHLAEVASCHQILTLVLGEAAEIRPEARERMYQLPKLPVAEQVDPEMTPDGELGDEDRAPEPGEKPRRRKPTVPDYLREPRKKRRLFPVAAVLLLAAVFLVIVLTALGQFERGTPLGDWWASLRGADQAQPELAERAVLPEPGELQQPAGPPEQQPEAVAPGPGEAPLPGEPLTPAPSEPPLEGTAPGEPAVPEQPAPPDQPPAEPGLPAEPGAELPGQPPAEPALPPDEVQVEPSPEPGAEPGAEPGNEPAAEPPDVAATSPQRMGRLMSEDQVLLRFDEPADSWQRVRGKEFLLPECKLVALPTYHPEVTLAAGFTLEVLGGSEIELAGPDGEDLAGLRIRYGRVFIMPLADAGTRLRLLVGEQAGVITFADAESVAAVEVSPVHLAGTDPEGPQPPPVAALYAKSGQILWQEPAAQRPVQLTARTCLVLDGQPASAPVAVDEFPPWVITNPAELVGLLDGRASAWLEREQLEADRPALLTLREAAEDRRKEVRWLAARCLAHLGRFDPMIGALNDPESKPDWPDCIAELRAAVARGPRTAAGVRQALEKQHGEDAAALYRMLWGYTAEELRDGNEAERLVGYLDHETLAFRVLSFWNLKELTGWGLFYKPDQTAAKREAAVQKWNERLRSGEIWAAVSGEPPAEGAPPEQDPEPPPILPP